MYNSTLKCEHIYISIYTIYRQSGKKSSKYSIARRYAFPTSTIKSSYAPLRDILLLLPVALEEQPNGEARCNRPCPIGPLAERFPVSEQE